VLTFAGGLSILPEKTRTIAKDERQSRRENAMPTSRRTLLKGTAATAAVMSLDWTRAQAQGETVRIGTIYDLSGPYAA